VSTRSEAGVVSDISCYFCGQGIEWEPDLATFSTTFRHDIGEQFFLIHVTNKARREVGLRQIIDDWCEKIHNEATAA